MSDNQEDENCRIHEFKRNNYFYGKLMTVRDFKDEQSYFNEKRYLINRLIHGSGLVCGLFGDDISFPNTGENVEIKFNNDGLALDCCGREIVIPRNTRKEIIIEESLNGDGDIEYLKKSVVPELEEDDPGYLYLRYQKCYDERVTAASNPSGCTEEVSESNRIEERFIVIFSKNPPDSESQEDVPDCKKFFKAINSQNINKKIKEWIEEIIALFPTCNQTDKKVLLACIKKAGNNIIIDSEKTRELTSLVYNNKLLSELLKCHITDFTNPHKTTAEQVGALVSIEGVSNPGGNINLVEKNTITIEPNDRNNKITIGETHSGRSGNPHNTKHEQLLEIQEVDPVDSDINRDKHVSNADANRWNKSILSINEIEPDNKGNFAINEGENISITQGTNGLTIASKGGEGEDCFTGVFVFRNIEDGSYNSPAINLQKKSLGFILGCEAKDRIITGEKLSKKGILLSSIQNINSDSFIINIENKSDKKIPELRVRWWAITPKDMGEVEVDNKEDQPRQVSVRISPKKVTLAPGDKQVFIADVAGSADIKINWGPKELIDKNILSEAGPNKAIFTAPKNPRKFSIVATSNVDHSKSDEATVEMTRDGKDKITVLAEINPPPIEPTDYLFSWDDIPGKDDAKLKDLLNKKFKVDWAKIANIEKIDDNTIKVSSEENSLSLELNDKKDIVTLKIENHTDERFSVREENGKQNVYLQRDDIQDRIQKMLRERKHQK